MISIVSFLYLRLHLESQIRGIIITKGKPIPIKVKGIRYELKSKIPKKPLISLSTPSRYASEMILAKNIIKNPAIVKESPKLKARYNIIPPL